MASYATGLLIIIIAILSICSRMLLKWQAIILNHLYQTTVFDKIIIKSSAVEDVDYSLPLELYRSIAPKPELLLPPPLLETTEFINYAHLLCKSKDLEEKKEKILWFDKLASTMIEKNPQGSGKERGEKTHFGIYHVIMFSCLSKCTIWPSMFKTSKGLVPALIEFYNRFFNSFNQYLDYKFDPLILSSKYSKLVKQIKEKRLAYPELFQAVQKNDIPRIREIVGGGDAYLINECLKNGLFISHVAAIHSNLDTLRVLLELKVNFELLDEEEQTALFYAVKRFDLDIVRFLVEEAKVNINHTEYQNRTPIYLAAFEGNLEIVEYLYSKGGNPEIQSKLSRTPLSKACYLGNLRVAEYLIKIGVRIQSIDSKGRTALHNAAWGRAGGRQGKRRGHIQLEDSPQCAELLIKSGHKIDFQDFDRFTPLFSAISSDAERSLRVLVKYGANLKHKTLKGQSSVFIACKYGHLRILKILVEEYQCEFEEQTIQGYSPIMAALSQDEGGCLKYLLDVYMKSNKQLILSHKTLECVLEFGKWSNLKYLLQWSHQPNDPASRTNKIQYISRSIDASIDELLQFTFQTQVEVRINTVLQILRQLQTYLSKTTVKKTLEFIEKYAYFNDIVISMLLSEHTKGLTLPKIPLSESITEQALIQLLQVNSNLTQSPLAVYHTLIEVVKLRMSRVILSVMSFEGEGQGEREGIRRYGKKEMFGIVFAKVNQKISVVDYCLIHGYFDMHKLLCSFYNENYEVADIELQERPLIPSYRYKREELPQQRKSYLMPITNVRALLNYNHLCENYLTKHQLELYCRVREDIKSLAINHLMIQSPENLTEMRLHLKERKIVGIDVQHYSSSHESFICLIQIATIERVFIIDKFTHLHPQVELFLRELFADEQTIKIFHSYDNDLKWLSEDYDIPEFHNVLDTSRIYSLMEAQKTNTPSLKWLASQFLGLSIKKEYQRSDWRIRPHFPEMAEYAATDAKVLPYLLLAMLEKGVQTKKGHALQLLKYMETKRMLRSSQSKGCIELV